MEVARLRTHLLGPGGGGYERHVLGLSSTFFFFLVLPKQSSIWKRFDFSPNVDANFEIFLF